MDTTDYLNILRGALTEGNYDNDGQVVAYIPKDKFAGVLESLDRAIGSLSE